MGRGSSPHLLVRAPSTVRRSAFRSSPGDCSSCASLMAAPTPRTGPPQASFVQLNGVTIVQASDFASTTQIRRAVTLTPSAPKQLHSSIDFARIKALQLPLECLDRGGGGCRGLLRRNLGRWNPSWTSRGRVRVCGNVCCGGHSPVIVCDVVSRPNNLRSETDDPEPRSSAIDVTPPTLRRCGGCRGNDFGD
jgi:hypothetical protein